MSKFLFFVRYRYNKIYRVLLILFAMAIIIWFFPKTARFSYEYKQGYPWTHANLIAPFDFAIYKTTSELAADKKVALAKVLPYYRIDVRAKDSLKVSLVTAFERKWTQKYDTSATERKAQTKAFVLQCFNHLFTHGIRAQDKHVLEADSRVMLVQGRRATEVSVSDIYTLQTAQKYVENEIGKADAKVDKTMASSLLSRHLFQNVHYDASLSEKEKATVLSNISLSYGMIQKGELIIAQGELVTQRNYQVLESLKKEYEQQLGGVTNFYGMLLGQILVLITFFAAILVYLFMFKRDLVDSNRQLSLLLVLILMAIVPQALLTSYFPHYLYAVPLPLLAIVGKSFFDDRTSIFVYSLTVLFIATFIPYDVLNFLILQTITGIVAIVSIIRLNSRAQFYLTSLWIFISYIVLEIAILLLQEGDIQRLELDLFYMFGISAVLTLMGYPSIYLFERIFSQVTDFTLLELSNTNNKLLKKLAHKAPGTFQHSLQVGNLAEAAIDSIGGNALLVRTGALYHDIGKIINPQYFIENQSTHVNPHEELSPYESAAIIIDHVVQGVGMAKRYGLPDIIIDFIRTHHGDKRPEYFYRMALKEAGEEGVDERDFKYPGPIPFSKETAVLMMADSIEAASRSIPKPTQENLNDLVDKIIDSQMADGQFDHADITFKDISISKKIFKKMLQTIYHVRIEYPD